MGVYIIGIINTVKSNFFHLIITVNTTNSYYCVSLRDIGSQFMMRALTA